MDQIAPSWLEDGVLVECNLGKERGKDGGGEGGKELCYPFRVSVRRWESPSTSKILTVRSDEQVARRRP